MLGRGSQARFGVAHGCRRVAVHAAKVALPIHQQIAHGKVLRHARHRFVNGHIAVRVILAQHFTNDTGRFFVTGTCAQPHVMHGVQDAPVDRFQPITGIRQGASNDHAHGVIQVCLLHLAINIDLLNQANFHALTLRWLPQDRCDRQPG